eukprot:1224180-Rhodomonas_salina.3
MLRQYEAPHSMRVACYGGTQHKHCSCAMVPEEIKSKDSRAVEKASRRLLATACFRITWYHHTHIGTTITLASVPPYPCQSTTLPLPQYHYMPSFGPPYQYNHALTQYHDILASVPPYPPSVPPFAIPSLSSTHGYGSS